MACGDKYAYLLVTSDGHTRDDPCSIYCGPLDYDKTRDVAQRVGSGVHERWAKLYAIILKRASTPPAEHKPAAEYPSQSDVISHVQSFLAKLDDLSHVAVEAFTIGDATWTPAVTRAWDTALDGTCVMDKLDAALVYYGVKVDEPPPPPGKKPDAPGLFSGGGLWVLGAAAVGIWYLTRKRAQPMRGRDDA